MKLSEKEQAIKIYGEYKSKLLNKQSVLSGHVHTLTKELCYIYCDGRQEERRRAIDLAYEYREKHLRSYRVKQSVKDENAFIEEKLAEECRYIGNTISGHNALSITLKEKDYWEQVKEEISKL